HEAWRGLDRQSIRPISCYREAHQAPPPLPSHAAMAPIGPTRLIRTIGRRPRSMISVTQSPSFPIPRLRHHRVLGTMDATQGPCVQFPRNIGNVSFIVEIKNFVRDATL